MRRIWKSQLLSFRWIFISIITSIAIILTQLTAPVPAQAPAVISDTVKSPVVIPTAKPKETQETQSQPTLNTPSPTPSSSPSDSKKNPENSQKPDVVEEPAPTPEEVARQQKFITADQLYLAGKIADAEKIYRELKPPFTNINPPPEHKPAIIDPEQLSSAGKVYWRESTAGIEKKLQTRTLVPLKFLVEKVPEFIPGHIRYAQALQQYNHPQTALDILERATSLYPQQADLAKTKVTALADAEKWMEASLAARQFAILNPQDPQVPEFTKLANQNLNRYKSHIQAEIRGNTLANIITGAVGYAVTGSILGHFTALDSSIVLLQGERSVGESVAKQAKKQLPLIIDDKILAYVNEIGQKLVKLAGRDEFKYEFFVIDDKDLNAFALPGGKIFINAGAIAKTNSEAELTGLIGHELSHVLLSHGFQLVTQGNLISNVTQYVPFGGTIGQLFGLSYSREMERQADLLGTRLLVSSGYSADGLYNLMKTLVQQLKYQPPTWLASHPGGKQRVKYLEELISQNGYNRYAYEGVERHAEIKARVKQLLKDKKIREHKK